MCFLSANTHTHTHRIRPPPSMCLQSATGAATPAKAHWGRTACSAWTATCCRMECAPRAAPPAPTRTLTNASVSALTRVGTILHRSGKDSATPEFEMLKKNKERSSITVAACRVGGGVGVKQFAFPEADERTKQTPLSNTRSEAVCHLFTSKLSVASWLAATLYGAPSFQVAFQRKKNALNFSSSCFYWSSKSA